LKKHKQHILFLLIVCISYLTSASAQVGSPQVPEVAKPTTVVTPSQTTETFVAPPPPPPRRRKRKMIVTDSLRLALQRDSIAKAAQAVANNGSPFNISPTATTTAPPLGGDTTTMPAASTSEVPILENSNNPFEILRGGAATIDTNSLKTKTMLEQAAPSLLSRETYSKNFLFWIFLITLSLMAVVVANGRAALWDAYQALLSNNALRHIYRLQAGWGNIAQLALYGLFLLNASIFAFLMIYRFIGKPPMNQFWTFLFCILGVCAAFLIKHTILYIISAIFPITKEIKLYNFIIITSGILLGLILLPLNIFIAYSPEVLGNILTYTAFVAIAAVYVVRSLRSLSVASPFLGADQFHFFIYLCAVELAPILILAKLLISKSPN
jgi:hypothetical protein